MKRNYALMVVISMVLFLNSGCGGLIGLQEAKNPPLTQTVYDGESSTLEISLPFALEDLPAGDFGDMAHYIFSYFDKAGIDRNYVRIIHIAYDEEEIEKETGEKFVPDIDGAIEGFIKDFKNTSGKKNFKSGSVNKINVDGVEARSATLSYATTEKNPVDFEGEVIVLAKGVDVWCIMTMDKKGDEISKAISDKVRKSIKIK